MASCLNWPFDTTVYADNRVLKKFKGLAAQEFKMIPLTQKLTFIHAIVIAKGNAEILVAFFYIEGSRFFKVPVEFNGKMANIIAPGSNEKPFNPILADFKTKQFACQVYAAVAGLFL